MSREKVRDRGTKSSNLTVSSWKVLRRKSLNLHQQIGEKICKKSGFCFLDFRPDPPCLFRDLKNPLGHPARRSGIFQIPSGLGGIWAKIPQQNRNFLFKFPQKRTYQRAKYGTAHPCPTPTSRYKIPSPFLQENLPLNILVIGVGVPGYDTPSPTIFYALTLNAI